MWRQRQRSEWCHVNQGIPKTASNQQKLERGKKKKKKKLYSFYSFQDSLSLLISWFWTSNHQACETINFFVLNNWFIVLGYDSLRKLIGFCSRATVISVISWFSKVGGEWGTEWRRKPWLLMPSALGAPKSGMWSFRRQQDLSGCWNPFHHGQWPWHIVWKELCRMQPRWTGGSHKWSEKMGQETRGPHLGGVGSGDIWQPIVWSDVLFLIGS